MSEPTTEKALTRAKNQPTWYDDDKTVQRLITSLKLGTHYEQACRFADIAAYDLSALLARGDPANAAFRGFDSREFELRKRVIEAEEFAHNRALVVIQQNMSAKPNLAQWFLERRFAQWQRTSRLDVRHQDGGASAGLPKLDLSLLSNEEFQQFAALVRKATPRDELADENEEPIDAEVVEEENDATDEPAS